MAPQKLLATGRIVDGEIHYRISPLEEQIDDAIEHTQAQLAANADILAMNQVLDDLHAGRVQPTLPFTDAELEALEAEPIGEREVSPWR